MIGRGAYVGPGVVLGDNCKVQNYALVYEPAKLGDGVFIGPAVVLTNDTYPRAVTPAASLKSAARLGSRRRDDRRRRRDRRPRGLRRARHHRRRGPLVAAGSVVTKDVARPRDRRRRAGPPGRLGRP